MSAAILQWLGGNDTGSSSKTLALAALGEMPANASRSYPHDGADFGRCSRLLALAPEARVGLEKLGQDGGPYWKALVARWPEIEAEHASADGKVYELLQAILRPLEEADRGIIRLGNGATIRFGGIV